MIRTKHILFLLLFSFTLAFTAKAGTLQQAYKAVIVLPEDSTLKKDSLVAANDPKQAFKDLFVTANTSFNTEQLNPEAISFVADYVQRFGKNMEDMKTWGKPYFNTMDAILEQHGLPKELKYLAVIESNLKSNVRSWAGAVGPWQFMPATARNYGLKVGKRYDERTDYYKSTHAACRYLTMLYSLYGDWLLVIAAYNGGPGKVDNAIRRSGSHNFWDLQNYLPTESRNHVKKFIATHYIMEGEGGITTLTKDELKTQLVNIGTPLTKAELDSSIVQSISGRYSSSIIVKHIAMDLATFNRLNPAFDNQVGINGTYELRLPNDKMYSFLNHKTDILGECIQLLLNPPSAAAPTSTSKKAF